MRIEVFYRSPDIDGRGLRLKKSLNEMIENVAIVDSYLTNYTGMTPKQGKELFSDAVSQKVSIDAPAIDLDLINGWDFVLEIAYKAGVTDPVAITAKEAIELEFETKLSEEVIVQTARQYIIKAKHGERDLTEILNHLYNPLIQRVEIITKQDYAEGKRLPGLYDHTVAPSSIEVERISLDGLNSDDLAELSKKRLLALTSDEMQTIADYYSDPETRKQREKLGIGVEPTDVEMEMLAQTWSEHCKHKILNSRVTYINDGKEEKISSLFKEYIKGTTDEVSKTKKYLKSVFHDDSGVIDFDEDHLVCFKVETHNSPSALDPYGGSITGIVGVNRDILGTGKGAKPLFNTNVLCFGDPDTPEDEIPEGLLHPKQVMEGVHHGIIDGGNQSGIPVAGGAFVFDDSYKGKPLVFCGTGGILPKEIHGEGSWIKHIDPGHAAVMLGGRIGKDGIHGATFSSLALDEESPTSAVQIGDPITQKKMSDFLQEARDRGLYQGITDNGAGGISSSLGEMAEASNGIDIRLDQCPLKYQGLAPWEILVSESQERMSLAVHQDNIEEFMILAAERHVEASVVGEFTDSGRVDLHYKQDLVGSLDLEFLHDGLPQMDLVAEWIPPVIQASEIENDRDLNNDLCAVLHDPSVASKEELVRQYDHEVKGHSIIKPFVGENSDAPSDGAVLKPVYTSDKGLTVTHGICQRYSDIDTYHMAMCAVDEAYRAHIAMGGNPELTSALDNFCWPDPVESDYTPDGKYKMAQLVRSCKGLKEACLAYGIPLISGKDSMKNDAQLGGKKVSVRPTLLVSMMSIVDDIKKVVTTDFKAVDHPVYVLGDTRNELGGTSFEKVTNKQFAEVPKVKPEDAKVWYKQLNKAIQAGLVASCHDLADGGLAVSLAESCMGGQVGAKVDLTPLKGETLNDVQVLFSETPSRFLISVAPENRDQFEALFSDLPLFLIGKTTTEKKLVASGKDVNSLNITVADMESAFKRDF